jgi:hypothetical protein
MNRNGIALAADSAVTITSPDGTKVWQSANKIFGLSRHHMAGVMVYGSADFMRLPWETVIKIYRDQLPDRALPSVTDYAENFLTFLQSRNDLFPDEEQEMFFSSMVYGAYLQVRRAIDDRVQNVIASAGSITPTEIATVVKEVVDAFADGLDSTEPLEHVPKNYHGSLLNTYKDTIDMLKAEVFQKLPLTAGNSRRLTTVAARLFTRNLLSESHSGIVIAGFGEDDLFPCIESFRTEGIVAGVVNYVREPSSSVSRDNQASIRAFAQSDVVYSFMEGVDEQYENAVEDAMHHIFRHYPAAIVDSLNISDPEKVDLNEMLAKAADASHESFCETLAVFRRDYYSNPVVQVVSVLPKDELASMAEALLNLTSFRRKVSMQAETVGGPIDVAVISKGDGFVWIKRKTYFSLDENPHFTARYN